MKNSPMDKDNYHKHIKKLMKVVNNLDELTALVVRVCASNVKANKCSLMLLDEKKKMLTIKEAKGIDENIIKNTSVSLGEGVAGLVALNGEVVLVTDKKDFSKFGLKKKDRYKSGSFISIPLKVKSETIGVLNLTDKINNQSFTEDDKDSLLAFVSFASIAIRNALTFKELQELSITDELTELYNRRHFLNCLEKEIERSGRYNRHFTLALLDIDKFKHINDTYGHPAGDAVLKHISKIFRTYTRSFDIVARYGGEEFVVIFHETNDYEDSISGNNTGLQFLERLRIAIENHSFTGIVAHKDLHLTISCGAAIYPIEGTTKEELISKADENLYLAKRTGRNKVCVSQEHLALYGGKILS